MSEFEWTAEDENTYVLKETADGYIAAIKRIGDGSLRSAHCEAARKGELPFFRKPPFPVSESEDWPGIVERRLKGEVKQAIEADREKSVGAKS